MEFSVGADATCDLPVAWTLDLNKGTKKRHRIKVADNKNGSVSYCLMLIASLFCYSHDSVFLSFYLPFTNFILIISFPFVLTHVESGLLKQQKSWTSKDIANNIASLSYNLTLCQASCGARLYYLDNYMIDCH